MKTIKIQIIGQDYSSFDSSEFKILNIEDFFTEDEDNESYRTDSLLMKIFRVQDEKYISIDRIKEIIIKAFLDRQIIKIGNKDLIINNTEKITGKKLKSKEKGNNYNFYSFYENKLRFGGIAGSLSDRMVLSKASFLSYIGNEEQPFSYEGYRGSILEDDHYENISFDIQLHIKSRFDTCSKPYFLATMMFHNKLKFSETSIPSDYEKLYDFLLVFWYKEQLKKAYIKGIFKRYTYFDNNDDRLKGNIDVARHIKENIGRCNGKMAYRYRENSFNNPMNHLIIAAYSELKRRFYELVEENLEADKDFRQILKEITLVCGDSEYGIQRLIKENQRPLTHPYYFEYEELRKTCLRILRSESVSIWTEQNMHSSKGFLFYLPDLWECYLEDIFRKKLDEEDICGQEEVYVFETNVGVYSSPTYPDFVIGHPIYMILDAKFVKNWESVLNTEKGKNGGLGKNLSDYTKCIRDMNSLGCHASGVVFPTNNSPADEDAYYRNTTVCHRISQYNLIDRFYLLPVYVPCQNKEEIGYKTWLAAFEKSIDLMTETLDSVLDEERRYYNKLRKVTELLVNMRG